MTAHVSQTDDLATCLMLRRRVFIEEQGVSEEDELDDLDAVCMHLLVCVDGNPVGTARIVSKGKDVKIGRVCVLKNHRGAGLGAMLIREALQISKSDPTKSRAVLGAQTHAIEFYEGLGFAAFGPEYDDAGIPHRDMECVW
ncbi:MAG: GNAT family N-acetyltransferase [Paracoccaceae bacterium]